MRSEKLTTSFQNTYRPECSSNLLYATILQFHPTGNSLTLLKCMDKNESSHTVTYSISFVCLCKRP